MPTRPRALEAALLALLAIAGPALVRGCTSFVVDCGDGAVVSARTLDYLAADLTALSSA